MLLLRMLLLRMLLLRVLLLGMLLLGTFFRMRTFFSRRGGALWLAFSAGAGGAVCPGFAPAAVFARRVRQGIPTRQNGGNPSRVVLSGRLVWTLPNIRRTLTNWRCILPDCWCILTDRLRILPGFVADSRRDQDRRSRDRPRRSLRRRAGADDAVRQRGAINREWRGRGAERVVGQGQRGRDRFLRYRTHRARAGDRREAANRRSYWATARPGRAAVRRLRAVAPAPTPKLRRTGDRGTGHPADISRYESGVVQVDVAVDNCAAPRMTDQKRDARDNRRRPPFTATLLKGYGAQEAPLPG